jgi:acetylornithine/succinyldiaminopimelate/putrescine aminotransferase
MDEFDSIFKQFYKKVKGNYFMEYLFRDSPSFPIEVIGADGSYLVGRDGRRYLDFMMGWCVGNAGWNQSFFKKKLHSFSGPTYVTPTYQYSPWETLAQKLVSLTPFKKGSCFRSTGGTEAVELAMKISRAYNRRKKFMAFKDAYHGQSFGCMGLVGLHEEKFGPYPDYYIRLSDSDWDKTLEFAIEKLSQKEVSAFISEPIICNRGVIVPPKPFLEEINKVCHETDTLLVMDEVATGFGRTGKWFGFEHYNVEPDIIVLAKGFSSGYASIGATIAAPNVSESMRFDFSNYSTFGWHPLSVEMALANIDYIQQKKLIVKSEKMVII